MLNITSFAGPPVSEGGQDERKRVKVMSNLEERKCSPCSGFASVLAGDDIQQFLSKVDGGWELSRNRHLERTFKFDDFAQALKLTNEIGRAAEEDGHHPVIHLSWGKVVVELWTHELDGLTENDFISAARYDRIYRESDFSG